MDIKKVRRQIQALASSDQRVATETLDYIIYAAEQLGTAPNKLKTELFFKNDGAPITTDKRALNKLVAQFVSAAASVNLAEAKLNGPGVDPNTPRLDEAFTEQLARIPARATATVSTVRRDLDNVKRSLATAISNVVNYREQIENLIRQEEMLSRPQTHDALVARILATKDDPAFIFVGFVDKDAVWLTRKPVVQTRVHPRGDDVNSVSLGFCALSVDVHTGEASLWSHPGFKHSHVSSDGIMCFGDKAPAYTDWLKAYSGRVDRPGVPPAENTQFTRLLGMVARFLPHHEEGHAYGGLAASVPSNGKQWYEMTRAGRAHVFPPLVPPLVYPGDKRPLSADVTARIAPWAATYKAMSAIINEHAATLVEPEPPKEAAAPAASAEPAGGPSVPVPKGARIQLTMIGPNKIAVIKEIRDIGALGLKEAKDLVDSVGPSADPALLNVTSDFVERSMTGTLANAAEMALRNLRDRGADGQIVFEY